MTQPLMIVRNLVAASPMRFVGGNDSRRTLVRWMSGHWVPGTDGALDADALEALKGRAWSEGVAVIIGYRLARASGTSAGVRELCQDWTRGQAAAELGRRMRLRSALRCLAGAGIETLVLKGAALAQWLYPAPFLREFSDVDLLFASRADAERAAEVLASLGYVTPYRAGRFRHELLCRSADGTLDLDLHWRLSEWPVLARLPEFDAMCEARLSLPGLDATYGLGAPHALLHACVHRASNLAAGLGDRLKWLYDVHLLAATLDAAHRWGEFVDIARQAEVCGICAEGLAASADLFGTMVPRGATQALEAGRANEPLDARRLADWHYLQRMNFRALSGWGRRVAWLWSRLLPPAGHMRELYGERHGPSGLIWQRLRRAGVRLLSGSTE